MNGASLQDRVILVTGATGALGSVAARACADAGATVVLLARKVRKLEQLYDEILSAGGPTPAIYPLDLAGATEPDYADLAETLKRELGGLHGVMHAAAELGFLRPLADLDAAAWQRLLLVNLTAPFLMTRALTRLLAESGDGRIVFVGDSGVGNGKAFWGAYGVAKLGLAGYARILDQETGSSGPRAEVFTPGPIRSPIRLRAYPGENLTSLPLPDTHAEHIVSLFVPSSSSTTA
jgi:NAD(P)-dependent dehydrogenase (short-subunit alcohol dehydrogenase family)